MSQKFKRGDKVVPHTKSVTWDGLFTFDKCCEWKESKKYNQPFLYVKSWNDYEQAYELVFDMGRSGNFYKESDLTLYKEENNKQQELITIETQPRYQTIVYTYPDGTKKIDNEFLEIESHKVIFNGTATIVILEDGNKGIKGVAKLDPNDNYDLNRGYLIAKYRAYQKLINQKLKELTK